MDPDAALEEILELIEQLWKESAEQFDVCDYHYNPALVRLIELVQGLDEWIRKGGFLPQAWRH